MRSFRSSLLDRTGKPICYFFEGSDMARSGDSDMKEATLGFNDTADVLKVFHWRELLRMGRFVAANVPMVRGALVEQCSYAFPLEPQYAGADTEWGDIATEWLYGWDQACTLKGIQFDMTACGRLRRFGRAADGDIFTILTADPDSQYPKTQLVRAHRVGDRLGSRGTGTKNGPAILPNGPYRGYAVCNGIIEDKWGRPIAIQILGQTAADDEWIPMANVVHSFRPEFSDYPRGITEFLASIRSISELKRLNDYELRAQNIMSSLALIEKNETGTADEAETYVQRAAAAAAGASTGTAPIVTETFEAGLIRYLKSGTGASLEAFRGDRPSSDAAAFEERIVRRAFYGMGWDADFALALKEPGGAWARKIIASANKTVEGIQALEARDKRRLHVWALANAVYKLKVLPPPKDGDLFSWNYRGPAKITADSGNEETAKREALKLGTTTLSAIALEKGEWWTEIREQRQTEVRDLLTRAAVLKTEFPELSLSELITLLEQRSPNPQALNGQADSTPADASQTQPSNN